MRRFYASCLLIATYVLFLFPTARADVDKVKLRQLAQLPGIDLSYMVGYTTDEGYYIKTFLPADPPDPAALRKTLQGNAGDAPRYLALGNAYTEQRNSLQAFSAYSQAAKLYQQQANASPRDGQMLINLSRAQWLMHDKTGAEQTLSKALQLSPVPAEAWTAKAKFAYARVNATLYGPDAETYDITDPAPLKAYLEKHTLSAEEFRQAKADLEEVVADNEKAIQAAPKQGRLYADRSTMRSLHASQQVLLTALQADQKQVESAVTKAREVFTAEFVSGAALEDMFRAARLSKEDPAAQGTALGLSLMATLSRRSTLDLKGDKLLQALPETQRKDAQEFFTHLQSLSESPNKQTAVTANNYLGVLRLLMQTPEEALPPLRRALQLSPADRMANDLTLCMLTSPNHMEELASFLEQQVKTRNTLVLRLMLIKAYQKTNRSDAAEREARALVREHPDDLQANLFLAAILMMRSDVETNLQETGEQLRKSAELAQKGIARNEWLCAGMLRGIYLVLTDHVAEAREQFKSMLSYDSALEEPKSALTLLGSE